MGTYIRRKSVGLIFLLFLLSFFALNFCLAANLGDAFKTDSVGNPLRVAAGEGAGYNPDVTTPQIIGFIIKSVISIIGVLFLILAVYGGYTWMAAGGNEEQVKKAKDILINAIIGIIVVLAAYVIVWFVVEKFSDQTLQKSKSGSYIRINRLI